MRPITFLSIILIKLFYTNSAFADFAKLAKLYESGKIDQAISSAHHESKDVHTFLIAQKFLSKDSNVSFEELANFIAKHPYLAQKNSLLNALENKLSKNTSKSAIIKWFSHNQPISGKAYIYYYQAAMAKINDPLKLKQIIKNAWIYGKMPQKDSDIFYTKHKSLLLEEDHAEKISELIWNNQIEEAKKLFILLGKNYIQTFKAWISIIKHGKSAEHEFHKVKGSYKYNSGLLYAYLNLHKKTTPNAELTNLHIKAPKDARHAKLWWVLKSYYARELIERKNFKDAYLIVSKHSNIDSADLVESEWLSGWLALSFLKKPDLASQHFNIVYNTPRAAISIARGAYWLGRSSAVMGKKDEAKSYYQKAAYYGYTYYGMLAQQELGYKKLNIPAEPVIHQDDKVHLAKNHNAQIAYFLSFSSRNELMSLYAKEGCFAAKTDGEVALLYARIAQNLDIHWKTEIAKYTQQAGTLLLDDTYPTPIELPKTTKYKPLVYAIMRQESVFDQYAVSSANAYGLMQIIAPTAKFLAKDLGLKFDQNKLLSSKEYNIKLGSHYLANLMKETNSYIKTAAHYNAGPVIAKWDNTYGNPHKMTLHEVIDWVELIPYSQTRNYVQRVIENMQIYRYVLTQDTRLHIKSDLMHL